MKIKHCKQVEFNIYELGERAYDIYSNTDVTFYINGGEYYVTTIGNDILTYVGELKDVVELLLTYDDFEKEN